MQRSFYSIEGSDGFPGKGNIKASEKELHELKKKLKEAEEEKEILKKALAIFSSAQPRNINS
jgi:transposase